VAAFAEDVAIRRYGEQNHTSSIGPTSIEAGFAAIEAPDLLVGDVRAFFRDLRSASASD
jgi:epoxide hydrolase